MGPEGPAGWPEGQLGQEGANWDRVGISLAGLVGQYLGLIHLVIGRGKIRSYK